MPEVVIGFISRVALNPHHGLGTKSHAMLVTDARTILLPWREGGAILGELIDAGIVDSDGIALAGSALNPETWAKHSGALVIPHSLMKKLLCYRALNTYSLVLEFKSGQGSRKLSGFLLPSRAYLRRKKREGTPASKSAFAYAEVVGAVLRQVAPLAAVLEWRL